jgi:hypothetical protein
MHVRIHEPGQHRSVAEIDDLRVPRLQAENRVARSNCSNATAPYRYGIRDRPAGAHGVNAAGQENMVYVFIDRRGYQRGAERT